jgi:hypothetical protein
MMRYLLRTCVLLVIVLFGGCVAQRIVWSPDGTRAAVLGDDGLHLCDVSGKLSPVLVADVKSVAWMPDSKHVVVSVQKVFKKWQAASRAVPDEVETARNNMNDVRDELAAAAKDWPTFFHNTKEKLHLTDEQLTLTLMYLRDASAGVMVLKLDQKGQEAYAAQEIHEDTIRLLDPDDAGSVAGSVLYRRTTTGNGIQNLSVSPNGAAVLVSCSDATPGLDEQDIFELLLVSTEGSKPVVLGKAAKFPDWSSEGKYVVFITPADWKQHQSQTLVGILARQQVVDDGGHFFDSNHLPAREDLAGLLFNELSRVRVANDGRILFSAAEISLPAAVKDVDTQPSIFAFAPGKQSTLTRVVPRGAAQALGDAAQYFELSPDARYVSIPFGDGRVSVLDIASGEAQIVQAETKRAGDKQSELASIPVWRTATELTFVRPVANSTAHEVVRYSLPDKTATVISADWPASIGGWLAPQESPKDSAAAAGVPK